MRGKRAVLLALVAALCVCALGCKKKPTLVRGATPPPPSTPMPMPMPTPTVDPVVAAKLLRVERTRKENAYIDMSNVLNGRFQDSLDRYFGCFGAAAQPNTNDPYAPYIMGDYYKKSIQEALYFTALAPETPDLDAIVKKLAPMVLDAMALIDKIALYYEEKAYLEDSFASGGEYHTALISIHAQIQELWDAFDEAISITEANNLADALADLQADERMIQYYAMQVFAHTKELLRFLKAGGYGDETVSQANKEEFQQYYEKLEGSIISFLEETEHEESMAREADFTNSARFVSLKREMLDMETCLADMLACVKAGKPAKNGKGTPSAMTEQLGEAIQEYNHAIG